MLDDREIWAKTLSLYAAARLLGASPAIAFGLQMLLGASSLAVLARVSWHRPSGTALVSAIVAATMLCSPYIWDYDQVCLAIPSCLAGRTRRPAGLPGMGKARSGRALSSPCHRTGDEPRARRSDRAFSARRFTWVDCPARIACLNTKEAVLF